MGYYAISFLATIPLVKLILLLLLLLFYVSPHTYILDLQGEMCCSETRCSSFTSKRPKLRYIFLPEVWTSSIPRGIISVTKSRFIILCVVHVNKYYRFMSSMTSDKTFKFLMFNNIISDPSAKAQNYWLYIRIWFRLQRHFFYVLFLALKQTYWWHRYSDFSPSSLSLWNF